MRVCNSDLRYAASSYKHIDVVVIAIYSGHACD